jgi:hypothetical protein
VHLIYLLQLAPPRIGGMLRLNSQMTIGNRTKMVIATLEALRQSVIFEGFTSFFRGRWLFPGVDCKHDLLLRRLRLRHT